VSGSIEELGEFGLIAALTARLPQGPAVLLGPGDDAAVIRAGDGRVVATTDLLVEGRHFRRDWSSAYDVGRKAAAQNLADVAAMGAAPTVVLVGLGAPGSLDVDWVTSLADGLRDECLLVSASVAGGDVVRADAVTVAVTALGDLQGRRPVTRSGARPGDIVAVCGRLGWSAAGHALLAAGLGGEALPAGLGGDRTDRFVEAHRRPAPPYAAGPQAADLGATALVDVSDGLLQDLGHVGQASRVRIEVRTELLADAVTALAPAATAVGADARHWVLTGGEDHALAGCFPPSVGLPPAWRVVGAVRAGGGVSVDGAPYDRPSGWDHFA
jgi:thiamine-monophosphate kinase